MNPRLCVTRLAVSVLCSPCLRGEWPCPQLRVCVFLLHYHSRAHCPHSCLQRPVSWVTLGSVKLTVRPDHPNPLSDNDCLLCVDSPALLFWYAPASHAHFPPLLTGLNQITLPFHTFVIWLLHFYTPRKRANCV